jgi:hypothetical protein
MQGNLAMVKLLHSAKANLYDFNKARKPPARLAADGGHVDTVKYLVENGTNVKAGFIFAALITASHPSEEVVQLFMDKGSNPNVTFINGEHILVYAARRSTPVVVAGLIRAGSNINVVCKLGERYVTPLVSALEYGPAENAHTIIRLSPGSASLGSQVMSRLSVKHLVESKGLNTGWSNMDAVSRCEKYPQTLRALWNLETTRIFYNQLCRFVNPAQVPKWKTLCDPLKHDTEARRLFLLTALEKARNDEESTLHPMVRDDLYDVQPFLHIVVPMI